MNIAILGTGIVARTVTPRLLAAGHSVVLGSRDPGDEKLAEWRSDGAHRTLPEH